MTSNTFWALGEQEQKVAFQTELEPSEKNVRLNRETEAFVFYYLDSRIFPPELNNEFLVVYTKSKIFCMALCLYGR